MVSIHECDGDPCRLCGPLEDVLQAMFLRNWQKALDEEGRRLEQLFLFGDPSVSPPLGVFYANDPEPDAIVEG